MLARSGVTIDRSTLADWVGVAAFHLRPVVDRLAEHLKASTKLFMDETTARVLDPGRGRGWSHKAPPCSWPATIGEPLCRHVFESCRWLRHRFERPVATANGAGPTRIRHCRSDRWRDMAHRGLLPCPRPGREERRDVPARLRRDPAARRLYRLQPADTPVPKGRRSHPRGALPGACPAQAEGGVRPRRRRAAGTPPA